MRKGVGEKVEWTRSPRSGQRDRTLDEKVRDGRVLDRRSESRRKAEGKAW